MNEAQINATELGAQAAGLRLHGLLAHWPEVMADAHSAQRVAQWLAWELAANPIRWPTSTGAGPRESSAPPSRS